jgi:parvulin-like peptidyl-prolyl isomerase
MFGVSAALLAASCSSTAPRASVEIGAQSSATTSANAAPAPGLVAIVDGTTVNFDDLRAGLVESAGDAVLRDKVVDLRLTARLKSRGIAIGADAVERERTILLDALEGDRARALELLAEVRRRQGLGDARFEALLRRNAGLRALVAGEVKIDDEGIEHVYDMLHGAKRVARVAVLASLPDAEALVRDRATRPFADLAIERSIDDSSARGGLLPAIARRDPSYPEAMRAAIFATDVGKTSAPVLDGARFFVIEVVSEKPADGTPRDAARARCERTLRLSRERLLMDALARELTSMKGVTVFDRAFDS